MGIVYAKYSPLYVHHFSTPQLELSTIGSSVLLFDPVLEHSMSPSIASRLRTIDPSVRDVEVLIVRGAGPNFLRELESDLKNIQEYTSAERIIALCGAKFGVRPRLITLIGKEGNFTDNTSFLKQLRQLEIEAFVRKNNALYQDNGYHYIHPSGAHAKSFLRLADALHDSAEVERIADWLSEYASNDAALLGDNGSLTPVLLALRAEAKLAGADLRFRTLSEYPSDDDGLVRAISDLKSFNPNSRIVLIQSVSFTGSLTRRFSLVAPEGSAAVVVVDCSHLDETEAKRDALSAIPIERFPVREADLCDECARTTPLLVDSKTYERLPRSKVLRKPLHWKIAEQHRDFWTAVDGQDAVRLHFDRPANSGAVRHHSVYIDVAKLLNNSWFRDLAVKNLMQCGQFDLALVPIHESADAVVDLLHSVSSSDKVMRFEPSRKFREDVILAIDQVPSGGRILVADDAIVDGTTLRGVRQEFYRVTQNASGSSPSPSLHSYVALCRPESPDVLKDVQNPYRTSQGLHLNFGYKLFLPGCGDTKCPWCIEESRLQRVLRGSISRDLRKLIGKRLEKISTRGLANGFLYEADDRPPSLKTKGSFFGELHDPAAFAAGVSAALEARLILKEETNYAQRTVLDATTAIASYFDPVFIGAIFRTLEPNELMYEGDVSRISECLFRVPTSQHYPGLLCELGWAAVNQKLPPEPVRSLLSRAERTTDNELMRELLKAST